MAQRHRNRRKIVHTDACRAGASHRHPKLGQHSGGQQARRIVVRARRAAAEKRPSTSPPPGPALSEPTDAQLAAEQRELNAAQRKLAQNRRTPPAGVDLLASYMDELSRIPLFTPEEEAANARSLEELELGTLRQLLAVPKAVQHLLHEGELLEPSLRQRLELLLKLHRRARGRQPSATTPVRARLILTIAQTLRHADYDKELLDQVVQRMRREVWSRKVINPNPTHRINHAQLTAVERSYGAARRLRNDFVRANLRLVVSVARNYHHHRIPFIDLIQEGNVGLMKAVHRFDHHRGFRFSTYAHWWIRQSIERAIINKGSQVRLPVHVIDSRRQVGRATAKMTQRLGRPPTSGEISQAARLPKLKVEQVLAGVQQDPVSLDECLNGQDPRRLIDLVRDESLPDLGESVMRENTHAQVRQLLAHLNPIEKDILRRRFGLGSDNDQTLDEIGKLYNLSRERVRQIQAQGLLKMRRLCERRQIS